MEKLPATHIQLFADWFLLILTSFLFLFFFFSWKNCWRGKERLCEEERNRERERKLNRWADGAGCRCLDNEGNFPYRMFLSKKFLFASKVSYSYYKKNQVPSHFGLSGIFGLFDLFDSFRPEILDKNCNLTCYSQNSTFFLTLSALQ